MRKRLLRRLGASGLAAVMVVSSVPVSSFAEEVKTEVVTEISDSGGVDNKVETENPEGSAESGEGKDETVESGEGKDESVESGGGKDESVESGGGKDESVESGEGKDESGESGEGKDESVESGEGKDESVESGEGKDETVESGEGKDESVESGEGKDETVESGEGKEETGESEEGSKESSGAEEETSAAQETTEAVETPTLPTLPETVPETVPETLPPVQNQLMAAVPLMAVEQKLTEITLTDKTVDVVLKPGMDENDLEEIFNDEVLEGDPEDYEMDIKWYYYGEKNLVKNWVKIGGEKLQKSSGFVRPVFNYDSLSDFDFEGDVQIGVNRENPTYSSLGIPSTKMTTSTTINLIRSAKITYTNDDSKGKIENASGGARDEKVKFDEDLTFKVIPQPGLKPIVTVGMSTESIEAASSDETGYLYEVDNIDDDIEIHVGYEADYTNMDEISYSITGGTAQIEYKGNIVTTEDSFYIENADGNRTVIITPDDGYAIESINETTDFADNKFNATTHALEYTIGSDETQLSIVVTQVELKLTDQNPELTWYDGIEVDTSAVEDELKQLVDLETSNPGEGVIDPENITIKYDAGSGDFQKLDHTLSIWDVIAGKHKFGNSGTSQETILFVREGNNRYPSAETTATLTLTDNRLETAVQYTEGTTFAYSSDRSLDSFKKEIYEQAVTGVSPVEGKPAYDKFEITLDGTVLGVYMGDFNVGTKNVTVFYKGDSDHKPSSATFDVEIVKAPSSVSVRDFVTITYGESIPDDFITTTPEGLSTVKLFAGINNDFDGYISVSVPKISIDIPVIGKKEIDLEPLFKAAFGDGVSLDSFLGAMDDQAVQTLLETLNMVGIDTETFVNALETISGYLPDSVKTFKVSIGTPTKAGAYVAVALTADPNYETAVDVGSITILPQTQNIKIQWNNDVSKLEFEDRPVDEDGNITDAGYALFSAKLVDGEELEGDSSKIHYQYAGTSFDGKFHTNTKPILDPGIYTEAAYVLNGDQMGWPITRTYTVERCSSMIRFDDTEKYVTYTGSPQGMKAYLYVGRDFDQKVESVDVFYTYNGSREMPTDAGDYEVKAYFLGNGWYKDAATQTATLHIEKADTQIHFDIPDTITYDGTAKSAGAKVYGSESEYVEPLDAEVKVFYNTSEEQPVHAGTYTVAASFMGDKNHNAKTEYTSMTIGRADPTITINQSEATYDGLIHEADYTVAGYGNDTFTTEVLYNEKTEKPVDAGKYKVTVKVSGNSDYNDTQKDMVEAVVINRAEPVITIEKTEAVYDAQIHETTYTVAGIASDSNAVFDTEILYNNTADKPVNAGSYTATVKVKESKNYTVKEQSLAEAVVINRAAPVITIEKTKAVYDTQAHETTYTVAGIASDSNAVFDSEILYNDVADKPVNAGSYTATVKVKESKNYAANEQRLEEAVVISKAAPVITIEKTKAVYDAQSHEAAYTVTGIASDSDAVFDSEILYNNAADKPVNAGSYTATVKVKDSANYIADEQSLEEAVEISKAAPVITIGKTEAVYDKQSHETTYTVAGVTGDSNTVFESEILYNDAADKPVNAGSYTATVKTEENANYTAAEKHLDSAVMIAKAVPQILIERVDVIYDRQSHPAPVLVQGVGEEILPALITYNGSETLPLNVGKYTVYVVSEETSNYAGAERTLADAVVIRSSSSDSSGGSTSGSSGSSGGGSQNYSSNGGWKQTETGWRYQNSDGTYVRSTWKQISLDGVKQWYYFNADGYMTVGWFLDTDGKWYYLNQSDSRNIGIMQEGWMTDPDDHHTYYLNPGTGVMATGWNQIDGKWYYFNETVNEASGWVYNTQTKKWEYVLHNIIPFGAMLKNTDTPDGRHVDENGVLVE